MASRMTQVLESPPAAGTAPVAARRPAARRIRVLAIIAVVALVIVALMALALRPDTTNGGIKAFVIRPMNFPIVVREKGDLKSVEEIEVKCEVEGQSTIVELADEGVTVEKGDLLVRLNSDQLIERIAQSKIEVAEAESSKITAAEQLKIQESKNDSDIKKAELAQTKADTELSKYREGDYSLQLAQKSVAVGKAERTLERAHVNMQSTQRLFKKDYVSEQETKEAEKKYIESQVDLEIAQQDLDIFERYTHPQSLQEREAAVEEADKELARVKLSARSELRHKTADLKTKEEQYKLRLARLEKLNANLDKTEILAPAGGLVVYKRPNRWSNDSDLVVGKQVRQNQTLMNLPDLSAMKAVIAVPEAQTSLVSVGQTATLKVEALDIVLNGKVTKIGVLANSSRWWAADVKEYSTEITLDDLGKGLKPDMTVVVEIVVGQVHEALAVPVTAVFSLAEQNFVFIDRLGRTPERREVKLGRASNDYVEILDGLQSGERVLRTYPGGLEELRRDRADAERERQDEENGQGEMKDEN